MHRNGLLFFKKSRRILVKMYWTGCELVTLAPGESPAKYLTKSGHQNPLTGIFEPDKIRASADFVATNLVKCLARKEA